MGTYLRRPFFGSWLGISRYVGSLLDESYLDAIFAMMPWNAWRLSDGEGWKGAFTNAGSSSEPELRFNVSHHITSYTGAEPKNSTILYESHQQNLQTNTTRNPFLTFIKLAWRTKCMTITIASKTRNIRIPLFFLFLQGFYLTLVGYFCISYFLRLWFSLYGTVPK